jgi:hypothetical protein
MVRAAKTLGNQTKTKLKPNPEICREPSRNAAGVSFHFKTALTHIDLWYID